MVSNSYPSGQLDKQDIMAHSMRFSLVSVSCVFVQMHVSHGPLEKVIPGLYSVLLKTQTFLGTHSYVGQQLVFLTCISNSNPSGHFEGGNGQRFLLHSHGAADVETVFVVVPGLVVVLVMGEGVVVWHGVRLFSMLHVELQYEV